MALNYVWLGLIIIGLLTALCKYLFYGESEIFTTILTGIFEYADLAITICIGLAGVMTFWMGIMNIGKEANLIQSFSKLISPFFRVIFPNVPKNSPAFGSMTMNFSANMLGLDNAATPLGLEAMQDLQAINDKKDQASNAMIMFLALNTAGITLIPTSIIALRQTQALEEGLSGFNGADIFLPTLIVTFLSFLVAMFITSLYQKINIFKIPVLIFIFSFGGLIAFLFFFVQNKSPEEIEQTIALIGSGIILLIILGFLIAGIVAKINVYDSFIEGAKGGFKLIVTIMPYLVAMLFAVKIFRDAGCLEFLLSMVRTVCEWVAIDTKFVDALPVGFMKPLSGGGARGVLVDVMKTHGVNSFAGKLGSIMQGSTETTFYVLAVYFGSVGIKNTRYAVWVGLLADLSALIIAILVAYAFYGAEA